MISMTQIKSIGGSTICEPGNQFDCQRDGGGFITVSPYDNSENEQNLSGTSEDYRHSLFHLQVLES